MLGVHDLHVLGLPDGGCDDADDATMATAVADHVDLIADELNVKAVLTSEDETAHAHLSAKPNYRVLGPRLGSRMRDVAEAIEALGEPWHSYTYDGEEQHYREIAEFERMDGRWYFTEGLPPVRTPVVREEPKIGRNDPCSCGSGRKFKRCHGDRPLPSLAAIDAAVSAVSRR